MLPLVNRMAMGFSNWLSPAYARGGRLPGGESPRASIESRLPQGAEVLLKPDLDQVEALNPERDALWTRLEGVSFLTDNEKRAAAGYGEKSDVPTSPGSKYNQNHDEAGLFSTPENAVPPKGGRSRNDGRVRVAQAGGDGSGYPVNLLEEEASGGHTFAEHVGKREEYLIGRITGSRAGVPYIFGVGRKRAGSFTSLEAANKLVNSVISEPINQAKLASFAKSSFPFSIPILYLYPSNPFAAPTGYEAYAPDDRTRPSIRPTNSVEVRILRTNKNSRGYYVNSAYPINED